LSDSKSVNFRLRVFERFELGYKRRICLKKLVTALSYYLASAKGDASGAGVASIHYTEYRVGLSLGERFFDQPELLLKGWVVFQAQTKTAYGDADRVMV
jgi:hypothetical protein